MKPDKLAGLTLIVGSLGCVVTMGIHPSGGSPEEIAREAHLNIVTHALAIISLGVLGFGFLRLTRTKRPERPYAIASLVVFSIAMLSVVLGATVGSILGPAHVQRVMPIDLGEYLISRAVFIAAISTVPLVWSLAMLRIGRSWTYLATAGILFGIVSLLGLCSGHLRTNVHDVGLVVLGFAIWTTVFGVLLCRPRGTREAVSHSASEEREQRKGT